MSILPEQYKKIWGPMGEEQASQWVFFDNLMSKGLKSLPGTIQGLDLLSETDKKALETTEQSWARIADKI